MRIDLNKNYVLFFNCNKGVVNWLGVRTSVKSTTRFRGKNINLLATKVSRGKVALSP